MSRNARDFYSLKRDLLREGRLFVDEEFPASNRSIVNNTAVPTEPPAKTVIWKRPKVRRHANKPLQSNHSYKRVWIGVGGGESLVFSNH